MNMNTHGLKERYIEQLFHGRVTAVNRTEKNFRLDVQGINGVDLEDGFISEVVFGLLPESELQVGDFVTVTMAIWR